MPCPASWKPSAIDRPCSSTAASAAAPTSSRRWRSARACVLLGRPFCYGLAIGGEKGVHEVLSNLIADIDLTLALAGCISFAEVTRERLIEIPCRIARSGAIQHVPIWPCSTRRRNAVQSSAMRELGVPGCDRSCKRTICSEALKNSIRRSAVCDRGGRAGARGAPSERGQRRSLPARRGRARADLANRRRVASGGVHSGEGRAQCRGAAQGAGRALDLSDRRAPGRANQGRARRGRDAGQHVSDAVRREGRGADVRAPRAGSCGSTISGLPEAVRDGSGPVAG